MPDSIYATYANKYKHSTQGEALFFHSAFHSNVKGLRVLLPDKKMEFTDNSFIGTDPSGTFYYDDIDAATTADSYKSDVTTNPRDGQSIAWVLFYHSNTLVAEFLADDYFNVVSVAGMVGHTAHGQWKKSTARSKLDAHLKKDANSAYITLDISEAIHIKATMNTSDSTLIGAGFSDITGDFHYDKEDDIQNGVYVSYTNDRLVFYKNDWTGTQFTGFFIPNGRADSQTLLGIQGGAELTLSGTRWDHTG